MSTATPEPYFGPTVYEAAAIRIQQIDRQITELTKERKQCIQRMRCLPLARNMLESERIAMRAESFQTTPLPE